MVFSTMPPTTLLMPRVASMQLKSVGYRGW